MSCAVVRVTKHRRPPGPQNRFPATVEVERDGRGTSFTLQINLGADDGKYPKLVDCLRQLEVEEPNELPPAAGRQMLLMISDALTERAEAVRCLASGAPASGSAPTGELSSERDTRSIRALVSLRLAALTIVGLLIIAGSITLGTGAEDRWYVAPLSGHIVMATSVVMLVIWCAWEIVGIARWLTGGTDDGH